MDAVEFFKTVKRLCKNQGCDGCPVCKNNTCMVMLMARIYGASDESIEETISKVEQWAKDHPVKTRQSEFLKMFPNAASFFRKIHDTHVKGLVSASLNCY